MKRKLVSEILIPMYYFFALCPFVSPVRMISDLKPYSLIVSCVILLMMPGKIRISKFFQAVLLVSMIAFLIMTAQEFFTVIQGAAGAFGWKFISLLLRKCVNYISVLIIGLVGFNIFLRQGGYSEIIIKRMILLWLFFGVAEMFFPGLMQIVTPGARSGFGKMGGRGVSGLAMEPSFYGYTCFFFMILAAKFKTERLKYSVLCVIQIVLIAQSAAAVLYLFVLAGTYVFLTASVKRKVIYIIAFIFSLAVMLYAANSIDIVRHSRMMGLFYGVFINPDRSTLETMEYLSRHDESIATRVGHIRLGFSGFFNDFGMPHGFLYNDRIMSGYGATLYELGLIGLAFIIMVTRRLKKAFSPQAAAAISIVMISAVQLASPTFIFLVAIAEYECYTAKRASNSAANIPAGSRAVMLPD